LSLGVLRQLLVTKQAAMTSRREEVATELAAIDADLRTEGAAAPKRGPGRPREKRGPGRPKGQSDLHNAIRAALNGSSEAVKLADIATKVKSGGYKTTSKRFPMIVGFRLKEMADVKRAGRGLYAMK
jgi:hypothetical protein